MADRGYDVRMRIVRLFWAGVQLESEGTTLVFDLLEHTDPIRSLMGDPRLPIVFGSEFLDFALVTHLHPPLRSRCPAAKTPSAKVFCDPVNAPKIARDGFTVMGASLYQPISVGPFTVTALPAVDGLGDPQVSFLVEAEDIKLMHFGDTLWHGHWWKIRARCGPPNVAFLPINGAIPQFPNMKTQWCPSRSDATSSRIRCCDSRSQSRLSNALRGVSQPAYLRRIARCRPNVQPDFPNAQGSGFLKYCRRGKDIGEDTSHHAKRNQAELPNTRIAKSLHYAAITGHTRHILVDTMCEPVPLLCRKPFGLSGMIRQVHQVKNA
jgi:hypothetical protein